MTALHRRPALVASALLAAGLVACQPKHEPAGDASASPTLPTAPGGDSTRSDSARSDSVLTISGTVHHVELEGGFWTIRADDGTTYDPLESLPAAFRQEGLRVRARVRPRTDMMSTHQMGTIVEIVDVQKQ